VRSARAAAEGTGLDLAICRHLVELHGGRMWLDSEPGRGTRFHVRLPAAPDGGAIALPAED
jgi:signal transduction histidine kinase